MTGIELLWFAHIYEECIVCGMIVVDVVKKQHFTIPLSTRLLIVIFNFQVAEISIRSDIHIKTD